MTAREALAASHLANWNVRKMPLIIPQEPVITDDGVRTPPPIPVPDMFATVRDNPIVAGQIDYLGVVGTKYEPVQNESSCAVLDAITDESGAHFEAALSARRPRKGEIFADRSVVNTFATLVVRRWLRSGSALKSSAQPSPPDRGAARRQGCGAPSSAPSLVSKEMRRGVSDS